MDQNTDGTISVPEDSNDQDPERSNGRGMFARIFKAFERHSKEDNTTISSGNVSPTKGEIPGVGNLRRLRVDDVAIPTVDIVAVPINSTKEALAETFKDSGMSRLPVYKGTLDHPLGLIHLKDFALTHGFNGSGGRFSLKKMLRPLLFAPPSMPIGVLLQKMQSERIHMALVIDEYGGVDGLLTIEDLIEQVVGEIEDEHDTAEENLWRLEKPGCYVAQAIAPLGEFENEIGLKLIPEEDEEEIDTLGGLVFILSGRVPTRGEVIPHPSGMEFEVMDADPRRIKRLRVRLPAKTSD